MAQEAIRAALVGVGNCASTLVQGVTFYRRHPEVTTGLMHPVLGGMAVGDIHFACAFDVDAREDRAAAGKGQFFSPPNNSRVFCDEPYDDGARVFAGPLGDGVAAHLENFHEESRAVVSDSARTAAAADVVRVLKETGATVLVNYLPVGSQKATGVFVCRGVPAGRALRW